MKAGWEEKSIDQISTNLDSLRKPITKGDRKAGNTPYYGASGVVDYVKDHLFDEDLLLVSEDGANLIARTYPISFSISGRAWVNNHAHVLRFRSKTTQRYVELFLNSIDLEPYISGMAQPKLNQRQLSNIKVPLPPLEEQSRIVAILDEALEGLDRARANVEANLRNARELFDEVVNACFAKANAQDGEVTTLGALAEFRNGLNYTRTSAGRSVKIVGVGDFKDHFMVPVDTLSDITIDNELAENDHLRAGDIVAVRSNGNRELIGRTMLVPSLAEQVSFSGFTIRVRLTSEKLLPEYLCEYMRTKKARRTLIDGGGGSNISNLNQGLLSRLPIRFPDLAAQRDTLYELELARSQSIQLVQQYETKLQCLEALRQSLLQKAFAGELT